MTHKQLLFRSAARVTAGASAIDIKRGLDRALKVVVDELEPSRSP
jgi:hypothetical protein